MHAALVVGVWLLLGWLAWLVIGTAAVLTWLALALRRALTGEEATR